MAENRKKGQCCDTCKYWDREAAKSPSGRVMPNRVARCMYEIPPLPESMPVTIGKIELRYMAKEYGKNCQCWEKRK